MTRWAMGMSILGSVLVAGLLIGCEANQPPEDSKSYDPNIDAPPTNLPVTENPDLVADQTKLARNKPTPTAGSTGSTATPTPPSTQPGDADATTQPDTGTDATTAPDAGGGSE